MAAECEWVCYWHGSRWLMVSRVTDVGETVQVADAGVCGRWEVSELFEPGHAPGQVEPLILGILSDPDRGDAALLDELAEHCGGVWPRVAAAAGGVKALPAMRGRGPELPARPGGMGVPAGPLDEGMLTLLDAAAAELETREEAHRAEARRLVEEERARLERGRRTVREALAGLVGEAAAALAVFDGGDGHGHYSADGVERLSREAGADQPHDTIGAEDVVLRVPGVAAVLVRLFRQAGRWHLGRVSSDSNSPYAALDPRGRRTPCESLALAFAQSQRLHTPAPAAPAQGDDADIPF